MSKGSLDDFHREAEKQAKRMAEQFRKQFDSMPVTELVGMLEFLKCSRRQEFIDKMQSPILVNGEPVWSFCATSAAMIIMTELERRRKIMELLK